MSETEVTTEAQVDLSDDLDAFSADFFGQKQPDPEPASSEAEQDEGNEAEVDSTEAQTTEIDQDEEEVEEQPKEAPKKKTVQDRIDELVRQREEAKREADARVEALRKEFEDKIAALQPQQKTAKAPSEPSPDDTNEDGTPKYALGEFDPQYIRDLTRHTLEQERIQAAERQRQEDEVRQEQQAREALTTEWNGKVAAATQEYPDFVEKSQNLLNGFNNLDQGYAGYLSTVIMSMEKGPDVLYYLSNHPEEAVKIVNSGAQKATLALGRIEARFLEADAQKQLAKPKVTKAPNPPPVRARGTNGAFISVAPDTDDLAAFEKEFFRR
jgi:hypothetical protein